MKRLPIVLLLLTILVLPLTFSFHSVMTDDCFIQIVSVTLNQASLEVGERFQVNLVYDLYYNPMDPLGIGSVSVSIGIQGLSIPLSSYEFTKHGFDVHETMTFDISPDDWTPNETGQVGVVQVEGWVQDSIGSMTDSVQQQFQIMQSDLLIVVNPLPSQITFHEFFNLSGALFNSHNSSLLVPNQPLAISVIQNSQAIQSWNLQTDSANNFTQFINSTLLGTGDFECIINSLVSNDYKTTNLTVPLKIAKAKLNISVTTNTTTVQAFYPSMNNYSILVSASLDCQSANHAFKEANVSCSLGNISQNLTYIGSNYFSTDIIAPSLPSEYSLVIETFAPDHNPVNTSIPISVIHRQAKISFTPNCSEAAYGDIIEFNLNVADISSQKPIQDKICSIYLFNQSTWILLAQITLDQTGCAEFQWQAQNVVNEDFNFKVVFHGYPEFNYAETEVKVTNTRNLRFLCNSTLHVIRPNEVNYVLQLTTLNYQPIFNVSLHLIENATNSTWCTSITNTSGYAVLSWSIDEDFILGPHEFSLIAENDLTILGTIQIIMIVYEQPTLELV